MSRATEGVRAPYRADPRPRPLRDGPVFLRGLPDDDRLIARRRERLVTEPLAVRVFEDTPGLRAALDAGLQHLGLAPSGDVDALVLAQPSDVVVVVRTAARALRVEGLFVSVPSGWAPRHRLGAGLDELHAPVADAARLRAAGPQLAEAVLVRGPLLQHVWGVQADDRLDRDTSVTQEQDWSGDPASWCLRVERQTTLPLPHLGRGLFVLRPVLTPLRALDGGDRQLVRSAVASMSDAALTYKGLSEPRDRLLEWLDRA